MSGPRTNAAFYAAPVSEFLAANDEQAYAPLAAPRATHSPPSNSPRGIFSCPCSARL